MLDGQRATVAQVDFEGLEWPRLAPLAQLLDRHVLSVWFRKAPIKR
jgi:hypothetical protein